MRSRLYEPNFDVDLSFGLEGEAIVKELFSNCRLEVKRDAQYIKTGNLYIEYQCRRQSIWMDSGIRTTEADWWCFLYGRHEICMFIRTEDLKTYIAWASLPEREETDGSHPTKGYLLNVKAFNNSNRI